MVYRPKIASKVIASDSMTGIGKIPVDDFAVVVVIAFVICVMLSITMNCLQGKCVYAMIAYRTVQRRSKGLLGLGLTET